MIEPLADIEALALRCHSDSSKDYIAEAILSYRAGAYRAAIVGAWIAVVFDLVDKIRELALFGDPNAKSLETTHENILQELNNGSPEGLKRALEFERTILDSCHTKLQFFHKSQLSDLERLKEDRNRCAHPSFLNDGTPYRPSAEQARLHIRNAIVHVLSQPPVQGKAALDSLFTLIQSEYFPTDMDEAVLQLEKAGLRKPTDALIRSLVDQLVYAFIDSSHSLFRKNAVITAINAVHKLHTGIVEERLQKQINKITSSVADADFDWVVYLAAKLNSAFQLLDQASRHKVERHLAVAPAEVIFPSLNFLCRFADLHPIIEQRILRMSVAELAKIISHQKLSIWTKKRAIQILSESRSWNATNEIIASVIMPLLDYMDEKDIKEIITIPSKTGADMIGANGYGTFISHVRFRNIIPEQELNTTLISNKASYLTPPQPESNPESVAPPPPPPLSVTTPAES
ncbi:hypothetical protein C8E02_1973 [Vogesella indigofera]|uniref:Uncharacterized protein n=1 Tax=Vogesella indigofera TaxID=45465 RepID=A0A495BDX8_VOGIN|nr:hypothetical protein [Vogesella indigofera]RKQ58997.1 hypothetical protein C8E02_1973 [Vogesella indigofera]